MVSLVFILTLFFSAPFVCIGVGLRSPVFIGFGVGFSLLYLVFFFANGFSELLNDLRARLADDAISNRLKSIWTSHGVPGVQARFWQYPSPVAEFKIWVVNSSRVEILFSQGLLEIATDVGLRAAFESVSEMKLGLLKVQNRKHAVSQRLERIKGPKEDFRYWFLSFWFYPLEHLLKIAKI